MRIFNDGAEMIDVCPINVGSEAVTAVAVPAHGFISSYCYKVDSGEGFSVDFTGVDEIYVRYRVSKIASPLVNDRFCSFRLGTTALRWIGADGNDHWVLDTIYDTGVQMNLNQAYCVEVYLLLADAPNGRFTLKVDGTTLYDFTGDTKPGAQTTFDNIHFSAQSNSTEVIYIDDIAINNTDNSDGLNDNSWCGIGAYVKAPPTGNGTTNNWTGSDGDSTDNYLMVDEYPKDDDTTYVYHDGSISGHQDQYAVTCPSLTGYTVTRIFPEARARKTAAVAHTVKLGTLAAGGSDVMSPARTIFVGGYDRVVGIDEKVNPVDSNPWEEADINALEFVVETG